MAKTILTIRNKPVGNFTELHGSCGFINNTFYGGDWFMKSPDYQAFVHATGLSIAQLGGGDAQATVFLPGGNHLIAEGKWVVRADGSGTFDNRTTTVVGGVVNGQNLVVEDTE